MTEKELEILVNSSNKITEHWRKYEDDILELIDSSDIKQTAEACYILENNSESILHEILNSVINNNFYSASILYRSLTEYFLRLIYIYLRANNDKNDNVGYEYNVLLKENETRQFNNSISELNGYIKEYNISVNKKYLKPITTSMTLEQTKNAKINFSYRNIIKYIFQNYNQIKLFGPDDIFFFIVMQEYLELSSFVHGGPTSTEIFSLQSNKDESEEINGFYITRSLKICNLQKFYVINLFINHNLKFSVPNVQILLELMEQFNISL
ncbi:MAG: hypothetical protein C4539_11180 [Ignavibacteriales bacterium]|nr:MAG: hypothetical protein C4539_11180 [Ignavibacteriales bacterium]